MIFVAVSCKKEDDSNSDPAKLKIGLVSAESGFGDLGYNDLALAGLVRAGNDFQIYTESYDCNDSIDIKNGIDYFVGKDFDMIICLSFGSTYSTLQAALANPSKRFVLIDDTIPTPPANMKCFVYQIDQASFLCGFLGAYWAQKKDPANPISAWVGGVPIPPIEQFKTGYISGIQYFNNLYQSNVQVIGNYTNSFADTSIGASVATALINSGADVIFPFAGESGLGSLYATKALGKWGIGVDVDQYYSVPQAADILISSCLKKIDVTIYNEIKGFTQQNVSATGNFNNGLSTNDVGYAPFHDFDSQIADSIRTELTSIRTGLINGSINTGW